MVEAPDLKIPESSKTVDVRIIDTTTWIAGIKLDAFLTPPIKGYNELQIPSFSFLIEHESGRKILFDLGVRKNFESGFSPRISDRMKKGGWKVKVDKHVREILEENGVQGKDIESIIWSHWHWDHTGDPSTFDGNTSLIVGPGFKKAFMPAWPKTEDSPLKETDFEGRDVKEVTFDQNLKIGNFDALDFFGDGSFYLLDSPGHAIGHLCALARVTSSPNSFIFMAGDACHHGGEFRPSQYLQIPKEILPHPFTKSTTLPCPGSLFDHLLRDGDPTKALYDVPRLEPAKAVAYDTDEALRTITKVQEADANQQVLVAFAHDHTLLDVVDFFPKYANGFAEKGWVQKSKWAFLRDFEEATKDSNYKRPKRSDE